MSSASQGNGRLNRTDNREVRLARIIARLNVGGPAIQAITLTHLLEPLGYRTRLIRGREGKREGSMDYLATELGVRSARLDSLRRSPGFHDLRALAAIARELRRSRPQIVHTHAAKAGTLGRIAALIVLRRRERVLVHTFHGHSLTGYFSAPVARLYTVIERFLAKRTDALIAVSEEVREELVRLRVAPREQFSVVPLGLTLQPFDLQGEGRKVKRAALRDELGVPQDAPVVTLVARLAPIKRTDRFLRVAKLVAERSHAHFLIAGDGELWEDLRASADARSLGERLWWAGFRRDMPSVLFASDAVVLTSDNEGTPVSLIEAQAAGVPVLSTDVGGVRSVVQHGRTGIVVDPEDEQALADGILDVLGDPKLAQRLAAAGRTHALANFSVERLVGDLDRLYRELLHLGR